MTHFAICPVTRRRAQAAALLLLAALLPIGGCERVLQFGRGGHEPATDDELAMVSVTLAADTLELFMEHPYLVHGQQAKFNVHLTVLVDGMPIRAGQLTVTATGPSGRAITIEQPAPRSPGIFGPVVAFPEAGRNELVLELASEQATGTIRVPVTVYADAASAAAAAEQAVEETPDGAITFLKEQAWKIGVLIEPVARQTLVERLTAPGEIVPAAGAKALVTPPIAGRLLPPDEAFPRVGERIEAGRVVALVEPPLAGPQGVQLLVNQAQIQSLETELAVKQLEIEAEIRKAQIDLDFTTGVYERLRTLGGQAITQRQVDEAERQFLLAKATYEARRQMREPYEAARRQLRLMLEPSDSSSEPGGVGDVRAAPSASQLRIALTAPISGTVTSANATAGEFVDEAHALFSIINLDTVWLEAKVSEYDLPRVMTAPAAEFTLAAYPDRRFSILGAGGGRLIDVGKVVDPGSRTVPVRYEIANPEGLLRIGLFAEVGIETARTHETLAIPVSALVDEDGRPTAYVQLDGESFQKRDLELGIRDGDFVEVKQGLREGDRVVVKGGYAIRLASVSAVIPAHGHTH